MVAPLGNVDDEAASDPEAKCRVAFKSFAGGGTSFRGFSYVSRVVDPNDSTWAAELKATTETCAARLGNAINLQRFISTELCHENGELAAGDVLEVETLTKDGPGTRSDTGTPAFAPLPQNSCR